MATIREVDARLRVEAIRFAAETNPDIIEGILMEIYETAYLNGQMDMRERVRLVSNERPSHIVRTLHLESFYDTRREE